MLPALSALGHIIARLSKLMTFFSMLWVPYFVKQNLNLESISILSYKLNSWVLMQHLGMQSTVLLIIPENFYGVKWHAKFLFHD